MVGTMTLSSKDRRKGGVAEEDPVSAREREKIDEVARLLRASEPCLRGKWAIELDEEGFEVAVMRDARGRPLAFMNVDAARAARLVL